MSKIDRSVLHGATSSSSSLLHEAWVDVVRVAAISLVVVIHVLNLNNRLVYLPVDSMGWLAVDAANAGTRWALPIFTMVTGYLLLDPRKPLDWHGYYHRRIQKIAWPLLAWTIIYVGLTGYDDYATGRPFGIATVIAMLIKGEPYSHLWYLYMLVGLYVVCPFIRLATDRMTRGQLIGAVALCFIVDAFSSSLDALHSVPNVTYIDDFPHYIGYFLAGHLFGRVLTLPRVAPTIAVLVASFLALTAIIDVVAHLVSPLAAHQLLGFWNPLIVVLSLAVFVLLRRLPIPTSWHQWLAWGGGMSFGVYLVHPAFLDALLYWTYPRSFPAFAAAVLFVFLSSVMVVFVMQRLPMLRRCI
jgi:surface polysaccharide O-acyltransferase-like enzyme